MHKGLADFQDHLVQALKLSAAEVPCGSTLPLSFLLLLVRPGAPSSVLAPSSVALVTTSKALVPSSFLLLLGPRVRDSHRSWTLRWDLQLVDFEPSQLECWISFAASEYLGAQSP